MKKDSGERIQYSVPKVTRDEATELVVWHLRMAAALFEASPEDGNISLNHELVRQFDDDEPGFTAAKLCQV